MFACGRTGKNTRDDERRTWRTSLTGPDEAASTNDGDTATGSEDNPSAAAGSVGAAAEVVGEEEGAGAERCRRDSKVSVGIGT